jgi:hypothetical protein
MDDGEFAVFELRGILLALFPIAQLAPDGNGAWRQILHRNRIAR